MTHKLIIEEYEIGNELIEVAYYFDGIESDKCSYYYVSREVLDMWIELNGYLKGTNTRYCQVINDTIDDDWEMTIEDIYCDYCLLKECLHDYLTKNNLITL